MEPLNKIPGIGQTSLELLEAAGFRDCDMLALAGVEPLLVEFERANATLGIADEIPNREQITDWIRAAREIIQEENPAPSLEVVMPANFEILPEVIAMLEKSPCAIPFPGRWLADSDIKVAEIVPGILLNRYAGDLEVRCHEPSPTSPTFSRASSRQYVQVSEKPEQGRLVIDVTRLRSFEDVGPVVKKRKTSGFSQESAAQVEPDAFDLITESLPGTNAGRDINSRRSIRGVLYPNPGAIRFGAMLTLILLLLLPLAIVVSPLLLLSDGDPAKYHWVRPWWVAFPFAVPVVGVMWMLWGRPCCCRICRQKLFVPCKHLKNANAHHVPILGYIVPLIFHLLIFQWFRCSHCGTPVRLKK